MDPIVTLRDFRSEDVASMFRVFHDAVIVGSAAHYTAAQRVAWCPFETAPESWDTRFTNSCTKLAVDASGRVIGFMNLTNDGLIDMAFVLPEMMGRGVASTLYASIEDHAVSSGLSELRTEASHLARPFFERHGWRVINAQTVDCNGVTLENYYMTKRPLGN